MNPTVFPKVAAGVTAALAVTLFYAAHAPVAAKAPVKTPKLTPAASISQGKGLIAQYRCNGCHGADLAGKQGFSPSLHQSASLKSYHQATFVRACCSPASPTTAGMCVPRCRCTARGRCTCAPVECVPVVPAALLRAALVVLRLAGRAAPLPAGCAPAGCTCPRR